MDVGITGFLRVVGFVPCRGSSESFAGEVALSMLIKWYRRSYVGRMTRWQRSEGELVPSLLTAFQQPLL